jgi:hypothetical protein
MPRLAGTQWRRARLGVEDRVRHGPFVRIVPAYDPIR